MASSTIHMYGIARNSAGKLEQVLAVKESGKPIASQFTGKIYRTQKEADADVLALNTKIALERRSFERMMA